MFAHGPKRPLGPVAPVFMNLHVKCPTFSAKDDEDAQSHLLCSNDWMNSHGSTKDIKFGRFCLISGSDAYLQYDSITSVGKDWNHLQGLFHRQFSKLRHTQEKLFQRWTSITG